MNFGLNSNDTRSCHTRDSSLFETASFGFKIYFSRKTFEFDTLKLTVEDCRHIAESTAK